MHREQPTKKNKKEIVVVQLSLSLYTSNIYPIHLHTNTVHIVLQTVFRWIFSHWFSFCVDQLHRQFSHWTFLFEHTSKIEPVAQQEKENTLLSIYHRFNALYTHTLTYIKWKRERLTHTHTHREIAAYKHSHPQLWKNSASNKSSIKIRPYTLQLIDWFCLLKRCHIVHWERQESERKRVALELSTSYFIFF